MNTPHYLPRFVIFQVLTHLISPIINNMIRYRGSLRRVCFRIYFIQKWTTWETNRFVLPRLGTTWSLLPVMKKHFERLRSCVWMLCNLVEMLGHTNNWGGQPCINLFFFFFGDFWVIHRHSIRTLIFFSRIWPKGEHSGIHSEVNLDCQIWWD